MKSFFASLFDYHRHFNAEVARQIMANEAIVGEKIPFLFSHIVNAHRIWNARILNEEPGISVNDVRPMDANLRLDAANCDASLSILSSFEFDRKITYKMRGRSCSNTVAEILFHIVNHTTHHRGQIVFDLRQRGIEPVMTDFILYKH